MHECCTITISHFNHGSCHCANQHHNFTLEITLKSLSHGAVYQELYTTQAVSYAEGAAGWMAATVLRGCVTL